MPIFEISIFGLTIAPTWYWLMYALGFIICYQFLKKKLKIAENNLDTLLVFVFFWLILWWRIWYIMLYNFSYYITHISEVFAIWNGGMSFHGWLIGVITAIYIFSKVKKIAFFTITDHLAIIIPIALGLWRIGNYINGELPGYSPYDWPFAIVAGGISYFPSPLLQMFLEWILLFSILFWLSQKQPQLLKKPWYFSGLFLLLYGLFRIVSEQFRLPDEHIGYLLGTGWLTLGMIYSIPLIVAWLYLVTRNIKYAS